VTPICSPTSSDVLGYTPTRHLTRNRLSVALRSGLECPQTPQAPYGRAEHQAGTDTKNGDRT